MTISLRLDKTRIGADALKTMNESQPISSGSKNCKSENIAL
ncbi:MAG: hypothetical protein ACI95C_002176 [Pseudohongiellaceae bacterium]|jgi:hypothetical protein